jgi:hypothetical protein
MKRHAQFLDFVGMESPIEPFISVYDFGQVAENRKTGLTSGGYRNPPPILATASRQFVRRRPSNCPHVSVDAPSNAAKRKRALYFGNGILPESHRDQGANFSTRRWASSDPDLDPPSLPSYFV